MRHLPTVATVLLLAGCGDGTAGGGPPPTCPPTSALAVPTSATEGGVTVTADRGLVAAGQTVSVTVHLAGPLHVHTDCAAPVELVVVDASDLHVFAESPPAPRGTLCGDVTLPPGGGVDDVLQWAPDTTLPSGRYTLAVTVGDLPAVTLAVELGHRAAEPCAGP